MLKRLSQLNLNISLPSLNDPNVCGSPGLSPTSCTPRWHRPFSVRPPSQVAPARCTACHRRHPGPTRCPAAGELHRLVAGFSPYPSEKWWSESQLGWWHSIPNMMGNIKKSCSKPPTRRYLIKWCKIHLNSRPTGLNHLHINTHLWANNL